MKQYRLTTDGVKYRIEVEKTSWFSKRKYWKPLSNREYCSLVYARETLSEIIYYDNPRVWVPIEERNVQETI